MTHDRIQKQHGMKALVVVAVFLAGAIFAAADDGPAPQLGSASRYQLVPTYGSEKVLANIKCGNFDNMGDYHYWFTPSGVTDVFLCLAGEVRTSHGNANLYVYLGGVGPACEGSGEPGCGIPRDQAGQQICHSTNGGTATDACNGCNFVCGYALDQVWRSYAVPASVPTDYCNEAWVYDCQAVNLSHAGAVRRGTEVDVTWEVTDEQAIAGYRLYRRFSDNDEWALITSKLVPASDSGQHSVVDTVPASAGDVFYRLEVVSLDGAAEHVVYISHEVPMNGAFPPRVE